MANLIVLAVIIGILCLSVGKIVTEKRKGAKCVGCPFSQEGQGSCSCK